MATRGKRRSFYADLDHMRSLFDSVDSNKTGYIGFKELCRLVENIPGVEESAVPELMEKLDRDKDGKVSFDDFEAVFAQEREEIKKEKAENLCSEAVSSAYHGSESTEDSLSLQQNNTLERLSTIREIPVSPASSTPFKDDLRADNSVDEGSSVILRHKVIRRATLPARLDSPESFSPIHTERRRRSPASELPDLATQMRYLTDVGSSPQLKRRSKVLSWISESGDMFDLEGTGQLHMSYREADNNGLSSPPLSPTKDSDEASNFKAILESVCHTHNIGKEAITKLCKHVKADSQEESELLTLLSHLDKDKLGYVSSDEFVRGLQFIRNAAIISSTPPSSRTMSLRRTRSEINPPPYFSTPTSLHPPSSFFASTPLPGGAIHSSDTSALMTVLDPDNAGVVKLSNLVNQWQQMGVDAPHNTSLEDALTEVVTVDPAGRVSVSELATSLEGALLSEDDKSSVLRQVAFKLYKTEISALRTKVDHISLERDTLRTSLNRTLEENKKLAKEGDEHADLIQQQSERKLKETEAQLTDRWYKEKRSREEETRQIHEKAAGVIGEMEKKLESMRTEEESLRQSLRIQQEEYNLVTNELEKAIKDLNKKDKAINMLKRDLGFRSELDIDVNGGRRSHLRELEDEITEKNDLVNELMENITEMQDRYDLLTAENEKLKQKLHSQKRSLLRQNLPKDAAEMKRHSVGDRPLSGSLSSRSGRKKHRLPLISQKLDLATEGHHHPILWENETSQTDEQVSDSSDELKEPQEHLTSIDQRVDLVDKSESEQNTSEEDDDFLARSTTSLMHELQVEEERRSVEEKYEQPKKESADLTIHIEQLEQQLKTVDDTDIKSELLHQLERYKNRQIELEKLLDAGERHSQSLSASKFEVVSKLAEAEKEIVQQSAEVEQLKSLLSNSDDRIAVLLNELEQSNMQLEENRAHTEVLTSLKQRISSLEECNFIQTEEYLKLEEEKANAEREIANLKLHLQAQSELNESHVNSLNEQLESFKKSHTDLPEEANQKENTPSDRTEPDQEHSNTFFLPTSLHKLESERDKLSLLNEQLERENVELCSREKKMQTDIVQLRNQLLEVERELSDQSEVYMNEIRRIKEDLEKEKELNTKRTATLLAEMHSTLEKEMEESIQMYRQKLDCTDQDLKASQDRVMSLEEDMVKSDTLNRNLQAQISDMTDSEAKWMRQISDLEHCQSQYLSTISQLRADVKKLREESNINQRYVTVLQDETAVHSTCEETDFVEVAATRSPTRSPFKSDSEAQGKLITQMKFQLEKLQRLLLKSRQVEDSEAPIAELCLVQELLANNNALDSAAKQVQREYDAKNQELSQFLAREESELKRLEKEHKALEILAVTTVKQLLGRMDNFHENSNMSLDQYRTQIERAATMLESISTSIEDRGKEHSRAYESVLSDLDQSHLDISSYQQEVERLRARLNQPTDVDANKDNPIAKAELAIQNRAIEDLTISQSPGSSKRRVDEGSGQVIDSSSEVEDGESLLQQKDNEIRILRDELNHTKTMERRARSTIDELEHEVDERKHELSHMVDECHRKDNELKSIKSMIHAMEEDRLKAKEQEQQIKKLQVDAERSLAEQKRLLELQDALQEELTESRRAVDRLNLQQEARIDVLTMKHVDELTSAQNEIQSNRREVEELYFSLVDETSTTSNKGEVADDLTYSQLVSESRNKIDSLKEKLKTEEARSSHLESTLLSKMEEQDRLDAQFQAEHEEEVRALRQQKQALMRQMEELKLHCQQSINDQEKQNSMLLKEMDSSKAEFEKQLREKMDEMYLVYQQVADLKEEKKVLMDIVHQLCMEAGRQIDIV